MKERSEDWVQVSISPEVARALWAAMRDDDDLVDDYANLAVIHALNHFVYDRACLQLCSEQYSRLLRNLTAAKVSAQTAEKEMSKRWNSYDEIPF